MQLQHDVYMGATMNQLCLEFDDEDEEVDQVEPVIKTNAETLQLLRAEVATMRQMQAELIDLYGAKLPPDELMDMKDIAKYLHCSITVARRVMHQPNAPKAIEVPTSDETKLDKRYPMSEVVAYVTGPGCRAVERIRKYRKKLEA